MRESIKRRSMQDAQAPAFTDDDLRFRQLTKREQPAIQAVVFLLMDVSGSMSERDRQLAKVILLLGDAGTEASCTGISRRYSWRTRPRLGSSTKRNSSR